MWNLSKEIVICYSGMSSFLKENDTSNYILLYQFYGQLILGNSAYHAFSWEPQNRSIKGTETFCRDISPFDNLAYFAFVLLI